MEPRIKIDPSSQWVSYFLSHVKVIEADVPHPMQMIKLFQINVLTLSVVERNHFLGHVIHLFLNENLFLEFT